MILFAGTEIPSNRTLLEREGAKNVVLNYWGLRKRGLPKTKLYLINEQFMPDMKVWVDSGAAQADKANLSQQELDDYAADYEEFVATNYDRIEGWVEFDSQVWGLSKIVANRAAFDRDPKMWVVWHDSYSPALLRQWAEEFQNIAIPGKAVESTPSLAGITRALKRQHGTKFHGLAVAKPDNLRQIPFTTASTLSWLSPMRNGETIVWDNNKLVRYPKKMKAQARPRYKALLDRIGLDFQKFIADDTLEATRLAIWSYLQLEANVDKEKPDLKVIQGGKKKPLIADNSDDTLYTGLMEMGGYLSNNSDSLERKVDRNEVIQRDPAEKTSLPVFGYQMKSIVETDEDGRDTLKQVPVVQTRGSSLRQCDTCFIAANCPAFLPQNTCAYDMPIEIKTKDQLKSLLTSVVEIQGQRVAFMRMAEELNGGYADPNLSQEIDRLFKTVGSLKDLETNKEFIQITAQRQSAGGVLSAIFGDRVQAMKEMQQPLNADQTTMIIQQNLEG